MMLVENEPANNVIDETPVEHMKAESVKRLAQFADDSLINNKKTKLDKNVNFVIEERMSTPKRGRNRPHKGPCSITPKNTKDKPLSKRRRSSGKAFQEDSVSIDSSIISSLDGNALVSNLAIAEEISLVTAIDEISEILSVTD